MVRGRTGESVQSADCERRPISDFWLQGTVNRYPDYRFKAEVFDVGSAFGLAQGRISKLGGLAPRHAGE
jgi:hypothetical protein